MNLDEKHNCIFHANPDTDSTGKHNQLHQTPEGSLLDIINHGGVDGQNVLFAISFGEGDLMSNDSPVFKAPGEDPSMLSAYKEARLTFRHFWKEVATDFNRIVPALSLASVKAVFFDSNEDLEVQHEHMWIDEIDFDGDTIYGVLANTPNWIGTVSEGDKVTVGIHELSDWMCVIGDTVYGAYTVQVLRSRMSVNERTLHDDAWGLQFPNPDTVLIPKPPSSVEEHLAEGLADYLKNNPWEIEQTDEKGRTFLHKEVLYGRLKGTQVLLENGANVNARCNKDWTPLKYATTVGWEEIASLLKTHNAEE